LFTDALEWIVVPYSQRYRKPKDDRIQTQQIVLPGAPPVARPQVEARKGWGDPFGQTLVIDGVDDGSKIPMFYDPTQRIIEVDPDVEAAVRGQGREIGGEVILRDVTWTGPCGGEKGVRKLPVPVKAVPQDFMFRLSLATKRQELDARFAAISPEKWKREKDIAVDFKHNSLSLRDLCEVTAEEFMGRFDPSVPTSAETDGACAGNNEKKSPGGWGAIVCQERHYCRLFGPQASTSNNEMEYLAMLKAMELVPRQTYVLLETDSQMCIDSLTKFHKRWEKNEWCPDNGREVSNAAIIGPLARAIAQRWVCFRTIKGHSNDEWNDQAEK
jgi:ribonuclease HI